MTEEVHYDDNSEDFVASIKQAAHVSGVVAVEFFTCERCGNKQTSAHRFLETIQCGKCKTSLASKSPRPTQPGEITADMLMTAILAAKQMFPRCNSETKDWIDKQEGAVKVVAIAASAHQVHAVLDSILGAARKMSGGHG